MARGERTFADACLRRFIGSFLGRAVDDAYFSLFLSLSLALLQGSILCSLVEAHLDTRRGVWKIFTQIYLFRPANILYLVFVAGYFNF